MAKDVTADLLTWRVFAPDDRTYTSFGGSVEPADPYRSWFASLVEELSQTLGRKAQGRTVDCRPRDPWIQEPVSLRARRRGLPVLEPGRHRQRRDHRRGSLVLRVLEALPLRAGPGGRARARARRPGGAPRRGQGLRRADPDPARAPRTRGSRQRPGAERHAVRRRGGRADPAARALRPRAGASGPWPRRTRRPS